jgi:Clostripain family
MTGNGIRPLSMLIVSTLIFLSPAVSTATTLHGLVPDPIELQEILEWAQARGQQSVTAMTPLSPIIAAEPADPPQTWTFLFYDDADFSYAFDPWEDFRVDAHGGDNLQVLVLRDTNAEPARLYQLDALHNYSIVAEWGEVDMGDPTTMANLLIYAKTNFPADRYAMAVYDHGSGWYGACVDVTNGGWMTMDEMASGLAAAGGLDLLMFTAPCLMGSLEAVHELRDVVDVYIGSEELSGYVDWRGMLGTFCTLLDDSSAFSTEEIASQTLDMIVANSVPEYLETVAMGAVKASATGAIVDAVHDFAYYCLVNHTSLKPEVAAALDATLRFGEIFAYDREEVDLGDFTDQALARIADPIARQYLTDIRLALDAAVIDVATGSSMTSAHGLSIVFPETIAQTNENYAAVALDMTDHTYWDEFIAWRLTDDPPSGVPVDDALNLTVSCGPNPSPWTTRIRFSLPIQDRATLRVFDVAGRLVRTICDDVMVEGPHTLTWSGRSDDGREQSSGIYLMLLESGNRKATAKAMLVR